MTSVFFFLSFLTLDQIKPKTKKVKHKDKERMPKHKDKERPNVGWMSVFIGVVGKDKIDF